MTDPPPLEDEAEERRRLIAKYRATGNKAYLRAAACLKRGSDCIDRADFLRILEGPDSRGRGRPSEDDLYALVQMALLMERDGLSQWAAALKVASKNPGHSEEATARRLDRKFRENPDKYIPLARWFLAIEEHQRWLDTIEKRQRWLDTIAERGKEHQRAFGTTAALLNKIVSLKVK